MEEAGGEYPAAVELEADGECPWVPPALRPDQAAALGLDGDGELDVDTEERPFRR